MNATSPAQPGHRREALKFALGFALIAGVLFSIYAFPYPTGGLSERVFARYLAAYARAAGGLLSLIESNVVVSDTDILGRFPMRIVKNCDAIEINILFASAVLAFPVAWRMRLLGLALGLPLLVLLNLLRICSLYYVGVYAPGKFELFHLEVWPLVLVTGAALLFVVFANRTNTAAAPAE